MVAQALSHLRVIDLTHHRAGPYCTKLMAGFGADVIKIERPETGDAIRREGPFYQDAADREHSIPFLWLNTGKKSITLNLKTAKGLEIVKSLVQGADVLVENFSPHVMPELGLSYEVLKDINPGLIMVSISNFGQTGPYKDYVAQEIEAQALSGIMYLTGSPEHPPLQTGPAICQYSAGLHAYTATLMAVWQRRATALGQQVDVSIMECGLEHIELALSAFLQEGKEAKRGGGHPLVPWDMYPCQDGYAVVISGPVRHWLKGAQIFQDPRLLDDRYRHARDRIQHRQEVEDLIKPWLSTHNKQDICQAGQEHGLAFGYLAGLEEAMASPQHHSRQFFREIDHPVVGRHRYCSAPFKMSLTPWQDRPAPLLGEHNQLIYGEELGFTAQAIQQLQAEGVI